MEKGPHVFGIRHLSPAGAHHLRAFLDEIRPTAILIEGLSDATPQIRYLTAEGTMPPIAILAYTEELPVRTLVYPMANYSPEYQVLLWARDNKAHAEFIDLPSDVFLPLEYAVKGDEAPANRPSVYEEWAKLAGEPDHDTYWERHFEHNLLKGTYRSTVAEFSKGIRELERDRPYETAKNLIREAFMRNRIQKAIRDGHAPDHTVVVCGAYHASALGCEYPPMADEEFKKLPRIKTRLTLMPYSYYKLSSRSGYGAGNAAPAYFEMMWECMLAGDLEKLPSYYLSRLASFLRDKGTYRSPAEVIEGVRLAASLAALHGGSAPSLKDLRDAAVVSLGHGDYSTIAEAIAMADVGTAIGALPDGVSQTPIQDDFSRELKRLKLEKYKSPVAASLDLDLRENRRVKSAEAAFLDLSRSFFFHRLEALKVGFAKEKLSDQQSATWSEKWVLQWTPESEIELVECTLKGETIELAATLLFRERLESSTDIEEIASLIRKACECGLTGSMEQARAALQRLAADSGEFVKIAKAARQLSVTIAYGDVRKIDGKSLVPLMRQLFLRGTLLLIGASACNNDAAKDMVAALNDLNSVSLAHDKELDSPQWIKELRELSRRDDRNPILSGYATAILLERNLLGDPVLSCEVSRRLSPGIPADTGAGWFEGLSMRNRYALLSRLSLWEQLDGYLAQLDDGQFTRALVFLRRAFGGFTAQEKTRIAEILGEIWDIGAENASEYLHRALDETEQKKLNSLKEFDFGDL